MIESMEKDNKISTTFDRYFAGAQLPPCDLSKAKQVVSARARGRKVRRIVAAAVSSATAIFACFVIAVVFAVRGIMGWWDNMLPGTSEPQGYLIADTTSTSASYTELSKKYDLVKKFAPFSLANNASAQYTLYLEGDKEVLLCAELWYTDAFTPFRATVWCDLTEGKYSAEDFKEYRALPMGGKSYRYKTEYIDGEFVSSACLVKQGTEYIIDMTSPSDAALDRLVTMLKK